MKLLLILLLPVCFAAYTQDLVTNLPGLGSPLNFSTYSGYLQASSTKLFHYWLTESQNSPTTAPLVLWLNGGPGCSSMEGMFEELGPFRVINFGKNLTLNPFSWNTFANVLFIESPAGVGYSYATDGKTDVSDDDVSLENYNALVNFLSKFPEYKGRDFYITGESYAGVYLPTLAVRLIGDKQNFASFKGMAVGNGALDFPNNYKTMVPLYYYHGLVRDELYNRLRDTCCNGHIESCDIFDLFFNSTCRPILDKVFDATNEVDPYNLYDTCYLDGGSQQKTLSKRAFTLQAMRRALKLPGPMKDASLPVCAQVGNTADYLNRNDVRAAAHIPSMVPRWSECSNINYTTIYFNMTAQIQQISNAGVRVLIYNGDVDTVCNHVMNMQFLTQLNRTIQGPERVNEPWLYDGDTEATAGFLLKYSGNLDYVTVRGSGHMVPQDKPRESLQMIYNFIYSRGYSLPVPF